MRTKLLFSEKLWATDFKPNSNDSCVYIIICIYILEDCRRRFLTKTKLKENSKRVVSGGCEEEEPSFCSYKKEKWLRFEQKIWFVNVIFLLIN